MTSRPRRTTAAVAVALAVASAAPVFTPPASGASRAPSATRVATISAPTAAGTGTSLLLSPSTSAPTPYEQTEWFAAGTAQSYAPKGALGKDGRWHVAPRSTAAYRTRVLVRVPRDRTKFNGTVVVEWLNVTGGFDLPADLIYLSPELERSGYAWVGVSAQAVGVNGGRPLAGDNPAPHDGLRGGDPARYGSLRHPGDAFSYDIFSQVGRAVRANRGNLLGGLRPRRLLAAGESQSAFMLTTYIDAVQPIAKAFDGFLVHSRAGSAVSLAGGHITAVVTRGRSVRIRTDIGVPVLLLQTETDEGRLRYFGARQPDTGRIRLWDVAGSAHTDSYLVPAAGMIGCRGRINEGPTHYVVEAALHALDRWVRTGTPPPRAPRLAVTLVSGKPVVRRDDLGIAIGGIRTADIMVPAVVYSGVPADTSNISCELFGSTVPIPAATLRQRYASQAGYVATFTRATDRAIAAGYILPADRAAILAAMPTLPLPG
jgi:hypothetical protein